MSVRIRTFEERDYWVSRYHVYVYWFSKYCPFGKTTFPKAMAYADSELLRYREENPRENNAVS